MELGKEIVRRLMREFKIDEDEFVSLKASRSGNPFEVLITTIISQNTNDKNTALAIRRLKSEVKNIKPEEISKIPLGELEEILRPAGLYRQKARVIKEVASILSDGRLDRILSLPTLEEIRNALMKLPGVGPKTADVVISMTTEKRTIAIDRHIARVVRRLGIAESGGYEEIRSRLMEIFEPEDYLKAHLLLIKLGRTYCRARNPRCEDCPLKDLCLFSKATSSPA